MHLRGRALSEQVEVAVAPGQQRHVRPDLQAPIAQCLPSAGRGHRDCAAAPACMRCRSRVLEGEATTAMG